VKGLETVQRTVSQIVNAERRQSSIDGILPGCLAGNLARRGFPWFIHYLPSRPSLEGVENAVPRK